MTWTLLQQPASGGGGPRAPQQRPFPCLVRGWVRGAGCPVADALCVRVSGLPRSPGPCAGGMGWSCRWSIGHSTSHGLGLQSPVCFGWYFRESEPIWGAVVWVEGPGGRGQWSPSAILVLGGSHWPLPGPHFCYGGLGPKWAFVA